MLLRRKKKKTTSNLPDQTRLKETCLRPGRRVDLIVDTDLTRDRIDVRSTILHDVDKSGRLLVAQPFPRINRRMVGRSMEVTFLIRQLKNEGSQWMRVGYKTKLAGIVEDFPIGDGKRDSILVLPPPKNLTKFTLRLNYRLSPSKDRDLRLYIWPDRTKVEIMDISLGGVKFSHPEIWSFSVGANLTLILASQGKEWILEGRCIRSGKLKIRGFATVRFVGVNPETKREISALLQKLMRHQLAQRSGVVEKK